MGQPVATVVRKVGLGDAIVSGELGLLAATEGVGDPTDPPQAPPPARAHELLPPEVAFLLEAGVAAKISPGVPPSAIRRSTGKESDLVVAQVGARRVMGQ